MKNNPEKKKEKLILLPQISHNCDIIDWKFQVYVSPTGNETVQKEIDKLRPGVRTAFRVRLEYLLSTPKRNWNRPYAAKLKGPDDIYEIRVKWQNNQFRPFGFFGPAEKEFTILIWSAKKERVYDPPEAIESAEIRSKEILRHEATYLPLYLDGEEFCRP